MKLIRVFLIIILLTGLLLYIVPYPYKKKYYLSYLFDRSVAAQAWPGGVLVAGNNKQKLVFRSFGYHTYHKERKVRPDDIFDLASLTKVIVTTSVAMKMVEQGRLDLDEFVATYRPGFARSIFSKYYFRQYRKNEVRIRDLLAHASGLGHVRLTRRRNKKSRVVRSLLRQPLVTEPAQEVIYSDNNFIVLSIILETISGYNLDALFDRFIAKPLKLKETMYNPAKKIHHRVVPTDYSYKKKGYLIGEVHDNLSYALGGVSGHAGLFSTGDDLSKYCQMMLNYGKYGEKRIFKKTTVELFKQRANPNSGYSRCLGWDSPSDMSSGGVYLSDNSIGHTGYTGTSLWIDFDNNLYVILLTNAVHPYASYKTKNHYRFWRNHLHSGVYYFLGLDSPNKHLNQNEMFSPWYRVIYDKIEYIKWLITKDLS